MEYSIGQIIDAEVIQDFGDKEDFFRLRLADGLEIKLKKLLFQRRASLPQTLKIKIKYINDGVPVAGHLMPAYVNNFYSKGYNEGRNFEFMVVSVPEGDSDRYVVQDYYGIRYNLYSKDTLLSEGQKVKCKFTRLTSTSYNLEMVKTDVRVTFMSPSELGAKASIDPAIIRMLEESLGKLPEMANIASEIEARNPLWPVNAMKTIESALADWFVEGDMKRHVKFFSHILTALRKAGLYIIEDSRFLRNLTDAQRHSVQKTITAIVENIEPYRRTLELFSTGQEGTFVANLIEKMRQSGYLYHPARQFSTLMLVFRAAPELVQEYLGRIFATIMEWKLSTWTTDPFRRAFVDQFEIYIQRSRGEIDRLPQAETAAEIDRVEKIVTAIALQMIISGDRESTRYHRNKSLFYRYISLMRTARADELLDKSLLALLGVELPLDFNYDTIREPMMLMTRASVAPPQDAMHNLPTRICRCGGLEIKVSGSGLSIRRTDERTDSEALPAGMMPWLDPHIYLNKIAGLRGSQLNNLDAHRRLWGDIYNGLFEKRAAVSGMPKESVKADVGDQVAIVIDPAEIQGSSSLCWRCRIDDPMFISDEGYIDRQDIVKFNITSADLDRDRRTVADAFVRPDGTPRHFPATVVEIDADGMYHFALYEEAMDQVGEHLDYNKSYLGVITSCMKYEYSVISETGYSLFLKREAGDAEYRPGELVWFRALDLSKTDHLLGSISSAADSGRVDKVTALNALMQNLEIELEETPEDDMLEVDEDVSLTTEEVLQIVELLRFKALSSKELLTAFDYLQLARILAAAIGHQEVASHLETHAALLRMHQFYATNSRVDSTELETFRAAVADSPLLSLIFHRLEIVSWLGNADRDDDLWNTYKNPRNFLEKTLSSLVLSCNMAISDELDDVAKGFKSKIAKLLGVNFEPRVLKSYGSENLFKEFKSSIVYPARRSKNDPVEADPEHQQWVIKKVIAAFLNTSGGTLYIGINDATSCEAGLFEDFEYYKHRKAQIGKVFYDMKTTDNFCNFLANFVRAEWGANVAGHVEIEPDPEAKRDVIMVKVRERLQPVLLDGKIYVRRSASNVMLKDDETAEFILERKVLELRRREEINAFVAEDREAAPKPETVHSSGQDIVVAKNDAIPTSRWRPNVLHDYEDSYQTAAGYIYFEGDNSLRVSLSDIYGDLEPWCRLALVFSPAELESGYLLLCFESRRVLKVSLAEVVSKGENVPIPYFRDDKISFAAIAMPDDAMVCYLTDGKSNLYRRVISLNSIPAMYLTSVPEPFADVAGVNAMKSCDIIGAHALEAFASSNAQNMSSKQIGYQLRCMADTEKAMEAINNDALANIQ